MEAFHLFVRCLVVSSVSKLCDAEVQPPIRDIATEDIGGFVQEGSLRLVSVTSRNCETKGSSCLNDFVATKVGGNVESKLSAQAKCEGEVTKKVYEYVPVANHSNQENPTKGSSQTNSQGQ